MGPDGEGYQAKTQRKRYLGPCPFLKLYDGDQRLLCEEFKFCGSLQQ